MRDNGILSMEEIAAMGDAIAETAAVIDAATHRFLTQLREFDEVGGWHRAGALSCAHWLSWRVGMDLGAAREKVRVAKRLVELPLIDHALKRGEISYSKVRAMTRVATEKTEGDLLTMARNTTGAQLAKICRRKGTANRLEAAEARQQEECRRYVVQHATDDGMVSTQVRLHPEEAARFMKALQVLGKGNLADGAVAAAELALASFAEGATPGDDSNQEGKRVVRSPVEAVVHISAANLEGETELGDGISADISRRLLCDCGVVPMLEDERGKTIDVGRKKRTTPVALRRALDARDGGCRFPGCTNRLFTDAHHLKHWIDGGETNLENTLLLCRRHHRYLHEFGFTVHTDQDEIVFRDPQGRVIAPQGDRPAVTFDVAAFVRGWLDDPITPASNAPGWDGTPVDYERCLDALR